MKKWKSRMAAFLAAALMPVSAVTVQAAAVNNGTAAQVATNQIQGWPAGPDTYAETAVLMDAETGAVLYDKGKDEIRYPASITKLMTLLVAVENSSLDEQVTFTETGVRDVAPDSGNIGMQVGEVMSMNDCLHAAVIESANEVSTQIAEHVGGTEAHFIEMMNQRAAEIGCTNTHFVNANGLPDDNHYTTAYDMAKIMQAGLQNETFRKIIGDVSYNIPETNMSKARGLHTHVPVLAEETELYYEGCLGGKTGMTSAAQHTLVAAAERNGTTLISVTLRTADLGQACVDCRALWDYGFQNFKTAVKEGQGAVTVPKGTSPNSLEKQTTEENGERIRQYFYLGQYMGQVKAAAPAPEPTEAPVLTAAPVPEPTEAAGQQTTEGLSDMAKFLFVVMGVMVSILIILIIALVIKERKEDRKEEERKNRRKS